VLKQLFSSNRRTPEKEPFRDVAGDQNGLEEDFDLDFDIPSVEDLQKEVFVSDILHKDNGSSMNILAQGAVLNGNITVEGELKIYGKVLGDIISSSSVLIGESGLVEGNVKAVGMEVAGTFRGNAEVSGEFLVSSTGKIFGDLVIGTINVNAGATMNASIVMTIPESPSYNMVGGESQSTAVSISQYNGQDVHS